MSKYSHNHDCPFEAFITNLGKYNEGELVGRWVKFPVSDEELQKVFKEIGIGSEDEFGQPYEEWFITDYDMYVESIYHILGEYESIDSLNALAERLEEMSEAEYKIFSSAVELDEPDNLEEIIEIANDLDSYFFINDVTNAFDYGYWLVKESGYYNLKNTQFEDLSNYIDYERLGADRAADGLFTDHGYIERIV